MIDFTYNPIIPADYKSQRERTSLRSLSLGRVTYVGGDVQEFTDAEAFLNCMRKELPYRPTTGFRYEVLTCDPTVRKAVDDIA